ncbi:MAG: DUF4956 domain-containing protein [Bacteroidales bacterium]|nr:DUF4956 domain-containing protein [Bacteroidales bacterium]
MKLLQDFDASIAAEFAGQTNDMDLLGVPIFDGPGLYNLLIRFVFNLIVCWTLIQFFYYRKSHRKDYYFTFMMFAVAIFLLLFLLQNLKLEVGLALGLFGVFSLMRYRTSSIPIREMTYLFVIIATSIINAFGMTSSYTALIVTNILIVIFTWVFEMISGVQQCATKLVIYDKIDLVHEERREELIADLKQRTGLDIEHVMVGHINFLKDTAFIKVYYHSTEKEENDIDMVTKLRNN